MKNRKRLIIKQIELQQRVRSLANVNIVTCGNCGSILLHDDKAENIDCPYCDTRMDISDCPDYLYDGIENNQVY